MCLLWPVENFRNLLKSPALGLWEQEPDDDDERRETCHVDEVKLPVELLKRNRVDVLVEKSSSEDRRKSDAQATAAELVWEDFNWICEGQRGEGDIVKSEEDEELRSKNQPSSQYSKRGSQHLPFQ